MMQSSRTSTWTIAIAVDDFVMAHVGYAIQKMTEQEARSAWEHLDETLASQAEGENQSAWPG
ncbi:MAG: HypC/HybG/HupF family hydrogenase formation chaperone [Gallionella sp.]